MSSSRRWIVAAIVLAAFYLVDGIVFARLARGSFNQVRFWRLASWVTSGIAFLAHVGFERYRLRSSPARAALHASLAAAAGACGLAAAALLHAVASGGKTRPLGIALVVWPAMTLVPAFVVAWTIAALMRPSAARGDSMAHPHT